ncbi:Transglutaminase-like superfamily protein [Paenibacillus sp. UNC496MF]|uniref:transglutaminase domain-containing protein n=1 Tax=Paenibacillus sp. UNC496MF TaxID=1502753 RepID=UPI0008EA1707|nr:transglutaminase domain-containing protein [Paenibacillus sp. UNC496MF]SFI87656.1 Transglutaminase-like superfamily protein [Paenibacillus sp. UNC496MF]
MLQRLGRIALAASVLFAGLGFDDRRIGVASSEQTLAQLGDAIFAQLEERKTDIAFAYAGDREELSARIATLLKETLARDDYLAYNVDAYLYTIRKWGATANVSVKVTYRETAAETALVDERIRGVLPAILKDAAGDRERVRAIHDWIVTHVAYDTSLRRYTAYDALETGSAVCQGYSLLAYRMLKLAGIETRIAEGRVDSGSHVWNLVKADGRWYHMDATWDDPVPDRPGRASHAYFLKSDAVMSKDHAWTKTYPPAG